MKIGAAINLFESGKKTDVQTFNSIFTKTMLTDFVDSDNVEIGEIVGPEWIRILTITNNEGKETVVNHSFVPMRYYNEEGNLEEQYLDETDDELEPNTKLNNKVLSAVHLALGYRSYFLLQYLKGVKNPYHTAAEIGANLGMRAETVTSLLRDLEHNNLIRVQMTRNSRSKIVLTSEGLK